MMDRLSIIDEAAMVSGSSCCAACMDVHECQLPCGRDVQGVVLNGLPQNVRTGILRNSLGVFKPLARRWNDRSYGVSTQVPLLHFDIENASSLGMVGLVCGLDVGANEGVHGRLPACVGPTQHV